MLEVLYSLFCSGVMLMTSCFIINKILNCKEFKVNVKTVGNILILLIFSMILHSIQYTMIYSLTIYLINIIIFKEIFKISLEKSTICTTIGMVILLLADMITGFIMRGFFDINEIRNSYFLTIIANISVGILSVLFLSIKRIQFQLQQYVNSLSSKKVFANWLFFVLLIIDFSCLTYNITLTETYGKGYFINLIVIMAFIIIMFIYIQGRNDYKKLSSEYDGLFSYVQNFEDWIEKEQLNRHEYKNQLAVLRCLTKEKKVKDKIDEILEDNINIEGQAVTNLKNLPTGGIKGLMYYKAAIAQKQKINLMTDVSLEKKGILNKLSEKDIRILCKLIGIYFDNAIEAAAESRKKNLTIEVYELKDKVNIVFSNTFKNTKNMKDRNKKGVSSKGEGRGNGLYFASKLIKENKWIEERQEIIDNYYIQQISVKKNIKKKEFNH